MLSIANQCSDEELIREIDHFARNLIPEFIRRFDCEAQEAFEEAEENNGERIAQLESDLAEANARITDLESQVSRLECDLALVS